MIATETSILDLPGGPLKVSITGAGRPMVLVHGLLVNGGLWRHVVPQLAATHRCIVPDLPLGGHDLPMPSDADMSPPALARLIADLMEALDLHDVVLVGNDTGGALCQLVAAHHGGRIGALVLTNCDVFENFYPLVLRPLQGAARVPGFEAFLKGLARSRLIRRIVAATVSRRRYTDAELAAYFEPLARDPGVRRDVRRWLAAVSSRYTIEAGKRFPAFSKPVLLVWSRDDWLFPLRYAQRLAAAFPNPTLKVITGARAFVPEDQPDALLEALEDWLPLRRSPTPAV